MKLSRKRIIGIGITLLALPVWAYADSEDLFDVIQVFQTVLASLIPLIIGLAVLYFVWNLTQYILKSESVEGRADAKNAMIWGVIIIFVMVSLWGLVNVLAGTFDLDVSVTGIPNVPGGAQCGFLDAGCVIDGIIDGVDDALGDIVN